MEESTKPPAPETAVPQAEVAPPDAPASMVPMPAPAPSPAPAAPEPPAAVAAAAAPAEVPEESFATLLAQSEAKTLAPDLQVGQKVTGKIVKIEDTMAFLDVGRKGEATIANDELKDSSGQIAFEIDDEVTAYVISTTGGVLLSRVMSAGPMQKSAVDDALASGMPLEGLVTGVNKGGLEVEIAGARAFCPMSQIDLRFCENPAIYVGQRHRFRVTQVAEGGRRVVVSRRAILEEENSKVVESVRAGLRIGARLRGRVISLTDFGAFVDLGGGIEGLIHVSELSHGRVAHAKEVLEIGQEVDVEVLRIEAPKEAKASTDGKKKRRAPSERIALSLKTLADDPWATAAATFREGSVVTGKVVRLQPFGAFVELAPGIDGLLHVSNIVGDRKINHPKDVLSEGQVVEATVLAVDPQRKRIGLTLLSERDRESRQHAKRPAEGVRVGAVVEGEVDRVETFGVFVKLDGGGRGLIPNGEMATQKGADHKKQFPPGTRVRAQIIEYDSNTGRIRLSRKAAEDSDQRAEFEGYVQAQPKRGGFGTFADLLKQRQQQK